ncbi:MAG TPA: transposase [Candidatus Nanopelagicaceae bacterium]|nr:transposase [Candidatus Nanopelagicaceae bacterium]
MKATRIFYSSNLNQGKYEALKMQAKLLGDLRSEIWQKFGSINGVGIKDRAIRDLWLKEKRDFLPLSTNTWKETLRDTISDISLSQEAAKVNVRKSIKKHISDEKELKRLYVLLKSNKWTEDKYLTRMMRKYYHRGHNHTDNQIIVRSDNYSIFKRNGKTWISIPSLVKGKRIAIPLSSSFEPTGTLRIILRNNKVEIHFAIDIEIKNNCGTKIVGIDKGFTEVFVDSDGIHYGEGLGKIISQESDYLKKKYQARNKIFQIANKSNRVKKDRILKNNLGIQKLNSHKIKAKNKIRTMIFNATHSLIDKAGTIISEDLTSPIISRSFGKNMNRKLSSWTKGVIAKSLDTVSRRRSSSMHSVNASYSSQIDHRTGCLTGKRKGDRFYCEDGVVFGADWNAAKNVLARFYDSEISRWTNYKTVKSILLKRTDSYRLGLLNQDSSA